VKPYYSNWLDPNAYDYTLSHRDSLWAWEFIRRHPEYEEYWEDTFEKYKNEIKRYADAKIEANIVDFMGRKVPLLGTVGNGGLVKMIASEFDFESSKTIAEDLETALEQQLIIKRKTSHPFWGTAYACSAGIDQPDCFVEMDKLKVFRYANFPIREQDVVIKIDLSKSITSQLKDYCTHLLRIQKKLGHSLSTNKNRNKVLRDYLRVLDSNLLEVRQDSAASLIFPQKTNAHEYYRSCLKEARKLLNGGFRKWLSGSGEVSVPNQSP
jgi:hypothetical protein